MARVTRTADKITYRYILIPVIGPAIEHHTMPIMGWRDSIRQHFDEHFERVNVLYIGEYRDMFVGETSAINGRHIRNVRATAIYRNNVLSNEPGRDPESMPAISGPAILFPDYQVWK